MERIVRPTLCFFLSRVGFSRTADLLRLDQIQDGGWPPSWKFQTTISLERVVLDDNFTMHYTALKRGAWEKIDNDMQGPIISHAISTPYPAMGVKWYDKITNTAIKETTGLTDLPSQGSLPSSRIDATQFLVISAELSRYIHQLHKHYPLMPSPAELLPLTRSAHGKLGFNRWKKIWVWVYPSVPVISQPWTSRCGDRYDPQPFKRSSEWVSHSATQKLLQTRNTFYGTRCLSHCCVLFYIKTFFL